MAGARDLPAPDDEAAYRQAVAHHGDSAAALDDDAYDRLVQRIAAHEEAHAGPDGAGLADRAGTERPRGVN